MVVVMRRRRCLVFCSVSFLVIFLLLLEDGFPEEVFVSPPSAVSAVRSTNFEKSDESPSPKINGGGDCSDGELTRIHPSNANEEGILQKRSEQKEFNDAFASWITGTQNIYTILYIDFFPILGDEQSIVRGLAASRNIQKGEIILSVPFEAIISLDSIERDDVLSSILGRKNREMYGWDDEMQLLIVFLLYHQALGPSSTVYPYLQVLQTSPTDQMPFMWSKEDLHKIYPDPANGVRIATELIHEDIQAMYDEIIPPLARLYPDVFATAPYEKNAPITSINSNNTSSNTNDWAYSYRNFVWAFAMVNSRHWHLPCKDLDPITSTSNSIEDTGEAEPNSVGERIITSQEAPTNNIVQPIDSRKIFEISPLSAISNAATAHTFLLPFADLLNFGEPCARGEYNAEKRAFEITASCDIEKGQEVTFWYTDDCSDLVLANFGFIHPLVKQCKSLKEWESYSLKLEEKLEKVELKLTETQEYVEYLKVSLKDAERQLKQCNDLIKINAATRHGYKHIHLHQIDAFSDGVIEPPILDYIVEGQKLRSGTRRTSQAPFDDNL